MKNVLIVRLSAIGDVVMASGLITAVHARYPDAKITWLVEPAASALLKENPAIENVIIWPKKDWLSLWKNKQWRQLFNTIRAFRRQLHALNFDIALDAQGILKSSFLSWLSGAKVRPGLSGKEPVWLFHTHTLKKDHNHPVISSEYIQLAEHIGASATDYVMDLPYAQSTEQKVDAQLAEHGLAGRPYVVICPFTTRPQKYWFDEHWQATVTELKQRYDLPVVILGGPGDVQHAAKLCAQSAEPLVNLVGKTSLTEAVAVIDKAAALIGVDTGLTHVGIAKHTPTVAIFGSTRPYLETRSASASVIYLGLSCSPCRRKPSCVGAYTCMKNITPEQVLTRLVSLVPEGWLGFEGESESEDRTSSQTIIPSQQVEPL
ncbi:MAG: lipopolysaccharide heptosyltransferase II [Alteromonadaceae bacterium]|nr:MAG: lipopolysaccharide heptosyltransferase II [Alteromonadaceae bacterium]